MFCQQRIIGCVLFILIASAGIKAQQAEVPDYFSAEHRAVMKKWLAKNPKFLVAADKDCGQCANEIANQRRMSGDDYHPYYVVGDFNGDGKKDFAVALTELEADDEGRAEQKFMVLVFNAPFSRRTAAPAFAKDELSLRDGGLFFGQPRQRPYRLFIGLFGNDQGLTLIPRGRKYIAR